MSYFWLIQQTTQKTEEMKDIYDVDGLKICRGRWIWWKNIWYQWVCDPFTPWGKVSTEVSSYPRSFEVVFCPSSHFRRTWLNRGLKKLRNLWENFSLSLFSIQICALFNEWINVKYKARVLVFPLTKYELKWVWFLRGKSLHSTLLKILRGFMFEILCAHVHRTVKEFS